VCRGRRPEYLSFQKDKKFESDHFIDSNAKKVKKAQDLASGQGVQEFRHALARFDYASSNGWPTQ
jgi:hypothetical protein